MYYNDFCAADSIYSTRVKSEDDKYILEVPVPGFDKSDLNLAIKDDRLVLKAEKEDRKLNKAFIIDDKIDIEKIDATVINGLLTVTLPLISPRKFDISIN